MIYVVSTLFLASLPMVPDLGGDKNIFPIRSSKISLLGYITSDYEIQEDGMKKIRV